MTIPASEPLHPMTGEERSLVRQAVLDLMSDFAHAAVCYSTGMHNCHKDSLDQMQRNFERRQRFAASLTTPLERPRS